MMFEKAGYALCLLALAALAAGMPMFAIWLLMATLALVLIHAMLA